MEPAKLSVKSFAFAAAIIWGLGVLIVGVVNCFSPGYGGEFLRVISSIYPGYDASPAVGSVIIGTLYALLDGAIGGLVFAWLYNLCASRK